jgi:hypothetical protein
MTLLHLHFGTVEYGLRFYWTVSSASCRTNSYESRDKEVAVYFNKASYFAHRGR